MRGGYDDHDGSTIRAMSRSEHMQVLYGNCGRRRHKLSIAGESRSKKIPHIPLPDPLAGKSPEQFGTCSRSMENIRANPGMTLAEGAVAACDGAVDAAEAYDCR